MRRGTDRGVHRILRGIRAGERGKGEDIVAAFRERFNRRDRQLVARQRPGLVGAQHIDAGGFVDGRQAGQQHALPG